MRRLIEETATQRTYEVSDATGTVIGTDIELKPTPEQTNKDTLETQARTALQNNRDFIASTPDATAVRNQTKKLSAQVNGIIRLLLNELSGTD